VRTREIQADVERARAEELARRATWEEAKEKVHRLEVEAKEQDPPPNLKRVVILLDQAASLEEQVQARLAQVSGEKTLAEPVRKDLQDLISQLRAIVEETAREWIAIQFDKLKPQIHRAARRLGARQK
jgi:hypothetical protein